MRHVTLALVVAFLFVGCAAPEPVDLTLQPIVVLNDDGAWSWFEDERVILHNGVLWIGSVAAGRFDEKRKGDVDVVGFNVETNQSARHVLHKNLQLDDHDSPALWVDPHGRILAAYGKHGNENRVYFTRSSSVSPHNTWEDSRIVVPSAKSRLTYNNLHYLANENAPVGRVYNFFRGYDASFKPSYMYSDDLGDTWTPGGVVIDVPTQFKHRPYVKYASNGTDTVHLLYTEGHPRNYDNSVYHIKYHDGTLHRSNDIPIRAIEEGLVSPEEGTLVFRGDADNVAWVSDLHLDEDGHPYGAITVQKDSAGLPRLQGGEDHRYLYARYDGERWNVHEIAFGGTRLYPGEDDYTGNLCLDPADPNTVYISTDVDPVTGSPQPSGHYELYRGVTADGGTTWAWYPITQDSTVDNLRPIMPVSDSGQKALVWFRGAYHRYQDYETEVVGIFW
ncbi:MAG: BNR-4 repeat-containing protein [Planctomycetota bacterium]|jgi:hypothetical protein